MRVKVKILQSFMFPLPPGEENFLRSHQFLISHHIFTVNCYSLNLVFLSFTMDYRPSTVDYGQLTYFKDADEDSEEKRLRLFEEVSWRKVKNDIIKNVNQVRPHL